MKRIQVELLAVGCAFGSMALFADHVPLSKASESVRFSEPTICVEAASYLEGPPILARLDRARARWQVTDGHTTAWLDARSGELLEVEFETPR